MRRTVVIHNTLGRSVGRFRATAPARDRKTNDCGCGCGGAGTCGHDHGRTRDRQSVQSFVQQVVVALSNSSQHVQRLAQEKFAEGWSVPETVAHIRRSASAAYDSSTHADLSIDVTYTKGPTGKTITETRHYVVPNFLIDPRGVGPQPAGVAAELRRQPGHISMVRDGWTASRAEGYFKREKRELGDQV